MTPETFDLLFERLDRIAEAIEGLGGDLSRLCHSIETTGKFADEARLNAAQTVVSAINDLASDIFAAGGIE